MKQYTSIYQVNGGVYVLITSAMNHTLTISANEIWHWIYSIVCPIEYIIGAFPKHDLIPYQNELGYLVCMSVEKIMDIIDKKYTIYLLHNICSNRSMMRELKEKINNYNKKDYLRACKKAQRYNLPMPDKHDYF